MLESCLGCLPRRGKKNTTTGFYLESYSINNSVHRANQDPLFLDTSHLLIALVITGCPMISQKIILACIRDKIRTRVLVPILVDPEHRACISAVEPSPLMPHPQDQVPVWGFCSESKADCI